MRQSGKCVSVRNDEIFMVQTSLENPENLEVWLIFWKVKENLEKSGIKFQKFFSGHGGVREVFLIKLINLFLGCFFWSLSLKCVFHIFCMTDYYLYLTSTSNLDYWCVNCELCFIFGFFSEHSCFQGCIAYWCHISSILCLLCDSCFLHFESWYEVYCWHEIILFTDACFLNVLKILPSVPMV